MRQRPATIITLAVLLIAVPVIALAQAPTSLTLNPIIVQGGQSSTGQVSLSGPAPTGGLSVGLSSSNTAVASVPGPDSVTVPAGATTASFTVNTNPVVEGTLVTIAATAGGVTQTAFLTVAAPVLFSVHFFGTTTFTGGQSKTGQVSLTGPATSGGVVVQLSSSNTAVATVPPFVTVPAGIATASLEVTTVPVGQSAPVTITAAGGGVTKTSNQLNVVPLGLTLITTLGSSIIGGHSLNGQVHLNGPAPSGGLVVGLSSSNTAVATVLASITVPAGENKQSFTVTTVPVAQSTPFTITASAGGVTRTAQRNVVPPSPDSVTLLPGNFSGGQSSIGTVYLAGTSAGGLVLGLSSSNTAVATVPSSVTAPAGATTASFTVTTVPVAQSTPVTITATAGGVSKTSSMNVLPFGLYTLSLIAGVKPLAIAASATVTGGTLATGQVDLSGPAPAGGLLVGLSSSNTAVAPVQPSVTVLPGAAAALFTITTTAVAQPAPVTITATAGAVSKTAQLNVLPIVLSSVTFPSNSITGGTLATGQVNITDPGPPGGVVVGLSSSNTAVATVTPFVTVPAGATTASFTITTAPVAQPVPVTITAAAGGVSKTVQLTIVPPVPSSFTLSPISVPGGTSATGEVILTGPVLSGGLAVALTSNKAAARVPPSVTVPAGTTTASFAVTTVPVAQSTTVTITAAAGGVSKTAQLNVAPPELSSVTTPNEDIFGGTTVNGQVSLKSAAPSSGLPVQLSSSNTSRARVPPSVTVPAGATTASFPITTVPDLPFFQVHITATAGGVSKEDFISVKPLRPVSITLAPNTISFGQSSAGQVTLNGSAPVGGFAVQLSSSNPLVIVPASVGFQAGASTSSFTVFTPPSGGGAFINPINVTITATRTPGGMSVSAVLTVKP